MLGREEVSVVPREEEPLEEEAGVVLMKEEPGSLAGVKGPGAARSGPCGSPAALGESEVNVRTRSRTEPARWNGDGLLPGVVGSWF